MATLAQTASRPDRGVRPVGSYSVSDIENISLTNGNVNLSIPLAALPPIAGGALSWVLRAEYSSKPWDKTGIEVFQGQPLSNYTLNAFELGDGGGWRVGSKYSIAIHQVGEDHHGILPASDQDPDWFLTGYKWKMVLTTPDGAKHELRPVDYSSYPSGQGNHDYQRGFYKDTPAADSVNATMRYYSFDGSYLWAKIDPFPAFGFPQSWAVYLPDGTIVEHNNGIQRIKDTNGNSIKIWSDTAGSIITTHYQDELTGREIKYVHNSSTNTGQAQYQTVGGAWVSIDINYGTTSVHGMTYLSGNPCLSELELNTDVPVIRSIVFPQTKPGAARLQYTFSYNSDTTDSFNYSRMVDCVSTFLPVNNPSHGWGSLSRMVTPSGAIVEYSYQWDGIHQQFFDPNLVSGETITQKRVTHDGVTDTWDYTIGLAIGEVKGPDGSITTETFYSHHTGLAAHLGGADGRGGLVYRTERKLGPASNPVKQVTIERHWTRLIFNGGNDDAPSNRLGFNTVVDAEYTTLHNSSGAAVKMSAKTFQHDYNGNVIQVTEYDWFDPNLVSRDAAGVPIGVPSHPSVNILRTTINSYYNQATTSDSPNVYAKRTLPSGAPLILNALQQTTVGDSQSRYCYDNQAFGTPPTSGDLTKESRWDNINGQWLDTTYAYDTFGNRTSATDPSGAVTQYFYEDTTHANQTKVVVNPGTSPATEQATTMVYDYSTGALLSRTDPNGGVTETDYVNQLLGTPDPYLRPGVVTGPSVTSYVNGTTHTNQRHEVKTTYDDNARQVIVESDLNTSGDYKLRTRTTTDELGRTILVEKNEDGTGAYTISNQTVYVQMGKIAMASNPRLSSAATSDGWVRTTRDDLGRVIEVATFSNATQPPDTGTNANWTGSVTTTYNANETTVKDQANKERRSVANALGQLTRVIENPNGAPSYTTDYTYDQLGNLRKAVQGSQTRFFLFNSLSQLIRTKNPEQEVNTDLSPITDPVTNNSQWSIAYSYFPNGNLQSKSNARNITTGYTYDRMNRNLTVDYSDTAVNPDITRVYDTAPVNGTGRLHKAYAGGNETQGTQAERYEVSDYDATGRPLKIHQSFKTGGAWSGAYSTERKYDLAGNPTWQQYPSGRTVDWVYDNAGRLNTFKGTLGGTSRDYVLGTTYNAAGGRTREQFGTSTNIYHHLSYTSRGHLFDARIGTGAVNDGSNPSWNRGALRIYHSSNWVYGNGGADNNGNVYRMDHFIPLDANVSQWTMSSDYYSYDAFNRISSVAENKSSAGQGEQSVFRQDYAYDQWGNRTISFSDVPGAFNLPFNVDAATNRLTAPNGSISYDKDGNQTNDGYSGGGSRSYDAENRMTVAQGHAYAYDADGRRVRRAISGGQTHWQVFGVAGELVAEYAAGAQPAAPQKEYGYRGGQLLIIAESGSGGSASLVKPGSQSGVAIGKKTDRAVEGAAHGPAVVDEAFADLEFNEDSGSTTTDVSGDNDAVTLIDDKATGTTAGEPDAALSFNGVGGASLAEHPAGVAPNVPQKDYGRSGRSIVTVTPQGVSVLNPTAYQTPDPAQGGGAIDSTSNTGHVGAEVSASASAPGEFGTSSDSQSASARWFSFQSVPGQVLSINLKFDWQVWGNVSGSVAEDGGSLQADSLFTIDFSLNNGANWTRRVTRGVGVGGNGFYTLSDSGAETIALGAGQNIAQIQVRDSLTAMASANGGEFQSSSANAYIMVTISNIRLEVETDTTAPVISNVAAGGITATGATITWTTNENSDSQVVYGPTQAYGQSTTLNPAPVTAHSQGLSGLTPGTPYYYRVKSRDAAGNLATSAEFTFTTESPDTTPPTVTSRSPAAGATNVNADANVTVTFSEAMNAATVNGSTVELRDPSNALVLASVSYNAASFTATLDPTAPLAAGVTYTARVRGGSTDPRVKDVAGNALAADVTWTFTTAQSGSGGIKWLVTDHLGSTRMVIDETGSLEGIKRHDYLPFGEELSANVGIRSENNGYGADSTRQKFTSKERDLETGLDYFEARYYASKQGRFTSPDEFSGGPDELFDFVDAASENPTIYADLTEPQSLNKYQYCYNNPLSFIDIDGHKGWREWLKTGLEVASYVPGPIGAAASVVQAGVALAQGDYKGALVAAAGVVPGGKVLAKVGAAVATVAVAATVVRKVAKAADKGGDAASGVSKLAKTVKKAEGGGEEAVRIRHYTSHKGLEGIKQDGVIKASDKNRVFAESANKRVLSPRDAESTYGLKRGRGTDYVETTVPQSRVSKVKNPVTKVEELQIKGNVTLSPDATLHRRN